MALKFILSLCGEDCAVRLLAGIATLQDLERQAESNLRQSFAVVGLFNESDIFYDMLSARVDYLDTSLNAHVNNSKHETSTEEEAQRCKHHFQDPSFQEELLEASPEIAALNRLYHVAIKVNRFQLHELQEYSDLFVMR